MPNGITLNMNKGDESSEMEIIASTIKIKIICAKNLAWNAITIFVIMN